MSATDEKSKTLSYVDQIARHLWQGRVHGNAAVMIGCGFSLNATPVNPSASPFPLWPSLAQALHKDLRLPDADPIADDPLQLSQRYEERFGRTALHKRLQELVPDSQHEPGELHRSLLDLPWSDVFTTNYDTLLERTRTHLKPQRSYSCIRNHGDLVGSSHPRIVKLHGSFPECEPSLTVTSIDYKNYPKDHSLFVNTVQQSMTENAFLLLGFSGDDPNFASWSGWVRKNLKRNAPKIYLCVLSPEKDRINVPEQEKRDIAVVSLGALCDDDEPTYEGAYAKLFSLLEDAKPKDFSRWPYPDEEWVAASSDAPAPAISEDLRTLQRGRAEYPGWIVCPQEIRERLWRDSLESRLDRLQRDGFGDDVTNQHRLAYLRELIWRLDLCLYPLLDSLLTRVTAEVDSWIQSRDETAEGLRVATREPSCDTLLDPPDCMAELVIALVRDARENFDEDRYERELARLEKLAPTTPEWRNRIHYEKCLWAWHQLRYADLDRLLRDWPTERGSPFWQTRRASLLIIFGQYDDAWRILDATLTHIRSRLHDEPENIYLLSQEAWTMSIRLSKESSPLTNEPGIRQEYLGRWRELIPYLCQPFQERDSTGRATQVQVKREKSEKSHFDPGRRTVSHAFGFSSSSDKGLKPRAFVRLHEDSALQLRMGLYTNSKKFMPDVLAQLFVDNAREALSQIVRYHDKETTECFSRRRVAALDSGQIVPLFEWLSGSLAEVTQRISLEPYNIFEPPPWTAITSTVVELLSRLTPRLPEQQLTKAMHIPLCQND